MIELLSFSFYYFLDFLHKIICNEEKANITCEENQTLDIHEVSFGQLSEDVCVQGSKEKFGSSEDMSGIVTKREIASNSISGNTHQCVNDQTWAFQKTTEKCQGKQFCKFHVISHKWIGEDEDPCKGLARHLYIKYRCEKSKSYIF